jgi:hypothetical protein
MTDQPESLLLPKDACLLHVGPYKTGSSAIQFALHRAREQMREHGVVYPGTSNRAKWPGWSIMGAPRGWTSDDKTGWDEFLREVHDAGDSRVCVSTEDFARANPKQIARIVDSLGSSRVHVVAAARRLDKLLASGWQQRAQSFGTASYEEFLHAVLEGPTDHKLYRSFWASHDVAKMIARWTGVVGIDRFTLIVNREGDRELLPRTFEQLLGLPDGTLELDAMSNPSLSVNVTELLIAINRAFADAGWPDDMYHSLVRRGIVPAVKYAARSDADRPISPLPRWAAERVAELSDARVKDVMASGVRVVGNLDDLRTEVSEDAPASVVEPETIALATAVEAVRGLVGGAVSLREQDRQDHEKALGRAREQVRQGELNVERLRSRFGPNARIESRAVGNTSARDLLTVVRHRVLGRLARLGRRG